MSRRSGGRRVCRAGRGCATPSRASCVCGVARETATVVLFPSDELGWVCVAGVETIEHGARFL